MAAKTVPQKLKLLIDCSEYYDSDDNYGNMLIKILPDISGYPKVEIDGDISHDTKFITTDNYNEEKYELLKLDSFEIISFDEDEIIVCGGTDEQIPLTFSIKVNDKTGKLGISDIYAGFLEGTSFDEFHDFITHS